MSTPTDKMVEHGGPCTVPLIELLRAIPKDARLHWDTPEPHCASHSAPIGKYAHEAAAALVAAEDEIGRYRAILVEAQETIRDAVKGDAHFGYLWRRIDAALQPQETE